MVLDASMTLAWHFVDESTPVTQAVSAKCDEHAIIVPSHWFFEVANGLLVGERRRRSDISDSARFLQRLGTLDIVIDELEPSKTLLSILPLARAHGLTAYDTIYLELAERRGLPLASLDTDLCDAARRVGVQVVTDSL